MQVINLIVYDNASRISRPSLDAQGQMTWNCHDAANFTSIMLLEWAPFFSMVFYPLATGARAVSPESQRQMYASGA